MSDLKLLMNAYRATINDAGRTPLLYRYANSKDACGQWKRAIKVRALARTHQTEQRKKLDAILDEAAQLLGLDMLKDIPESAVKQAARNRIVSHLFRE